MKIKNFLWLATEPRKEEVQKTKIPEIDPKWKPIIQLEYAQDNMRQHIEFALDHGFNIIPIKAGTKTPAVEWKVYQERRSTNEEIEKWFFHPMETWPDNWQWNSFLIHYIHEVYLRPKIIEIQNTVEDDNEARRLTFKYEEPWCYWKWAIHLNKKAPSTYNQFRKELPKIVDFLEEHITKKYTWGWPILRKRGIELFTKLMNLPKEDKPMIDYMFDELQAVWLAHYPEPFLTKVYKRGNKNVNLGMLIFELIKQDMTNPNIPDLAEVLNLHPNTVHLKIMPKLRKHKNTLKRFGITLHSRR